MEPLQSIILVAAGLVAGAVLVGVAWYITRRRSDESYSKHLKDRFGPEYRRALKEHGSRREAERDLMEREQRADELAIRPLNPDDTEVFFSRWRTVQRRFVDEPGRALDEAHQLLEALMSQLGYPTRSYREEIELLSVHHPEAIDHYREAHRLHRERKEREESDTENQRLALIHYRELFAVLLDKPVDRIKRPTEGGARVSPRP